MEALFPIASAGEKILFCEPSCLSALKEDAPSLLRGEQQQKARPSPKPACCSTNSRRSSICRCAPDPREFCCMATVIRSRWGCLPATMSLLSRIPGATVVDLDAGCCGMAGSFGYTQEPLRRFGGHRQSPPAARGARDEAGRRPGRARHLLPASGDGSAGHVALHPAVLFAGF